MSFQVGDKVWGIGSDFVMELTIREINQVGIYFEEEMGSASESYIWKTKAEASSELRKRIQHKIEIFERQIADRCEPETTDELIQRLESAGFAKVPNLTYDMWRKDNVGIIPSTVYYGQALVPCNNFADAVKLALTVCEAAKK